MLEFRGKITIALVIIKLWRPNWSGFNSNDGLDRYFICSICSHLRCTGCDFRIRRFNHFKWRPGTDYLFLRNNMPEFDRVRVKLASAKFSRAYACQCKFVTVKDLVDLVRLGPHFSQWSCTGYWKKKKKKPSPPASLLLLVMLVYRIFNKKQYIQ